MTEGAIVQVAPDKIIYRASALGGCLKALVAARMEYDPLPPGEEAAGRFREGHLHEESVLDWLADQKIWFPVTNKQQEVSLTITDKVLVVGHIDALADTCRYLVEVKTQSQQEWERFEREGWGGGLFPKYKWQVSAYMLALDLPLLMVRKNRNSGQIKTEAVLSPFYSLADIRARVLTVEGYGRRGELMKDCDTRSYPCPYYYLHEDEPPMLFTDGELDVLAGEYEAARIEERIAAEKKAKVRQSLVNALGEVRKAETAKGTKITLYDAESKYTDWEQMKKDGIEFEKYERKRKSTRLRVTMKEDNGQT